MVNYYDGNHRGISHDVGNVHDIFFKGKNCGLVLVLAKWQIG